MRKVFFIGRVCPHCDQKVELNIFRVFFRTFKWIKCPACGNHSIFDYFRKCNMWGTTLLLLIAFTSAIIGMMLIDPFMVEGIVIILIALLILGYLFYQGLLKLRKFGQRREDLDPLKYELKSNLISLLIFLFLLLFGAIFAVIIHHQIFRLEPISEQVRVERDAIDQEENFKYDPISYIAFHRDYNGYITRKSVWQNKCQENQDYHCRFLLALGPGQVKEGSIENACHKGDMPSCLILFSEGNKDQKITKMLLNACMAKNVKSRKTCHLFSKQLKERGRRKYFHQVVTHLCLNAKYNDSCYLLASNFDDEIRNHEKACASKMDESCKFVSFNKNYKKITRKSQKDEIDKALIQAAYFGKENAVKRLVELGGNVNKFNKEGESLLHVAVDYLNLKLVRYLLEKGAYVNITDKKGRPPLAYVSRSSHKSAHKIFDVLLNSGAEINIRGSSWWSPFDWSLLSKDMRNFEILLKKKPTMYSSYYSADNSITRLIKFVQEEKLVKMFELYPSNIIFEKVEKQKLVNLAIKRASLNVVKLIVDQVNKYQPKANYSNGEVVLAAYARGDDEIIKFLESKDMMKPGSLLNRVRILLYRYLHWRVNL